MARKRPAGAAKKAKAVADQAVALAEYAATGLPPAYLTQRTPNHKEGAS